MWDFWYIMYHKHFLLPTNWGTLRTEVAGTTWERARNWVCWAGGFVALQSAACLTQRSPLAWPGPLSGGVKRRRWQRGRKIGAARRWQQIFLSVHIVLCFWTSLSVRGRRALISALLIDGRLKFVGCQLANWPTLILVEKLLTILGKRDSLSNERLCLFFFL
jgi:hypothetical protein